MAWTIEFAESARTGLARLDRSEAARIVRFLSDRVALLEDPRVLGAPLAGSRFQGQWRYRVGDYRVLCRIFDCRLVILVLGVGHRRDVYRVREPLVPAVPDATCDSRQAL